MPKLPRLTPVRVVSVLATLLVGYFAYTAVGDSFLSQRINREEQQLQQEIAELQRNKAQLEAIRDYLQTDEYIEGVARRLLGRVRPGETLVTVLSSATPTPVPDEDQSADNSPVTWWEALYGP